MTDAEKVAWGSALTRLSYLVFRKGEPDPAGLSYWEQQFRTKAPGDVIATLFDTQAEPKAGMKLDQAVRADYISRKGAP
jgi:hypothetical protein